MAGKKKSKNKKKVGAKKVRARKPTLRKSAKKTSRPNTPSKRSVTSAKSTPKIRKAPKKKARTRRPGPGSSFSASQNTQTLSGDLQGLTDVERADSESVEELLEEGNTFEAGVVKGVEQAEDSDEQEVHTREFPEDDVPEEYREKD
jgi:hypothetical protein